MSGGNSSSLSNGGPMPTTDGSTGGGEVPEEDQEEVLGEDEEDGVANEGGPITRSDGVVTPLSKQESRSIKPDDGEYKISKKEHNQDTSSEIR